MWLQLIERRACDWGRVKNSPLVAVSEAPSSLSSAAGGASAQADVPFTVSIVKFGKIPLLTPC